MRVNERFFGLRKWTNSVILQKLTMNDIITTSPKPMTVTTFRDYFVQLFPNKNNSSAFYRNIQSSVCDKLSIRQEKLKAFACHLFPPLTVGCEHIDSVNIGEIIPQFTVKQVGKRFIYQCELCKLINGSNVRGKPLEGVSQMYMHGTSSKHRLAVDSVLGTFAHARPKSELGSSSLMLRFLGRSPQVTHCEGIWDPCIVDRFSDDQAINRMSISKMFAYQNENKCSEHPECNILENWMQNHPEKYQMLKSTVIPQAIFVHEQKDIIINKKQIHIHGRIKSIIPPCDNRHTVTASCTNKCHRQNLCKHCYTQFKYLKNLLRKRQYAALASGKRLNTSGMRRSYLTKEELRKNEHLNSIAAREDQNKPVDSRSKTEWLSELEESCQTN